MGRRRDPGQPQRRARTRRVARRTPAEGDAEAVDRPRRARAAASPPADDRAWSSRRNVPERAARADLVPFMALPAETGPTWAPDRLSIWPVEGGRFGIDAHYQGASGRGRARQQAVRLERVNLAVVAARGRRRRDAPARPARAPGDVARDRGLPRPAARRLGCASRASAPGPCAAGPAARPRSSTPRPRRTPRGSAPPSPPRTRPDRARPRGRAARTAPRGSASSCSGGASPKCVMPSAAGCQAADRLDRALPRRDVDVGRRRRRDREVVRRDPGAAGVADERVARRLVEVGDVMRGVAGRVLDPERALDVALAAREHAQVRLRHRDHLAPQRRASPPRRRTAARRSRPASPGRPCAARRARARRPAGPASGARARRTRPRGRSGCG